MITFDRHTHGHTDTRTHYFLTCKLHWSGELQRPDGLVSTSDFSTGQLIKLSKYDQHDPNHFRLKNWRSVTGVNLYSYNRLNQRLGQTVQPFLRYLNLKKSKNQKIMGRTHARIWTSNYISSIPFHWGFCNKKPKNQLKRWSRSWDIASWRTLESDWSIPF